MSQRKFFQSLFVIGQEATQDMMVWVGVGGGGALGQSVFLLISFGGAFDEQGADTWLRVMGELERHKVEGSPACSRLPYRSQLHQSRTVLIRDEAHSGCQKIIQQPHGSLDFPIGFFTLTSKAAKADNAQHPTTNFLLILSKSVFSQVTLGHSFFICTIEMAIPTSQLLGELFPKILLTAFLAHSWGIVLFCFVFSETGPPMQSRLASKFPILLPQPHQGWNYKYVPSPLTLFIHLLHYSYFIIHLVIPYSLD